MDNIHKVIFNKNTQQFVVVSELAKSTGKPKSVSADSVDIVSVLQNFSEKRPLVENKRATSGLILMKNYKNTLIAPVSRRVINIYLIYEIRSLVRDERHQGALYGQTGGYQPIKGGWYIGNIAIPYKPSSFSDMLVESFAGTHDYLGGQLPGWYNKQGNTLENKNAVQTVGAEATTILALPVAAPFAVSDLLSSDMVEVLFKLGGQ